MKPSLNINNQDPKYSLLKEIFNVIDSNKSKKIYARNNIKNTKKLILFIKLLITSQYFDYTISDLIYEKQNNEKLKKFLNDDGYFEEQQSFYSYMSNLNADKVVKIVNSILKSLDSKKRGRKTFIVDATPIECDINIIKQYITKEQVEKLELNWGYSTTKGHYLGFKLTMTLNKDTLLPVSILIHPGSPNDAKLFDEILKELKRRRIIKYRDKILFDRGYYSSNNYIIGITQYKIIPIIFPRKSFNIQKFRDTFSYPLDVFKKSKKSKQLKKQIKNIYKEFIENIENWKELKPIRGLIEDFFKVSKEAFNMGKIHKYTSQSVLKTAYFTILLTSIAIMNGYTSKTGMQQLAEGKLNQKPIKKPKKNKKTEKTENNNKEKVPKETQDTLDSNKPKETQTKLEKFIKK